MSKSEIYIVRHGETEWNAEGRLQGWLDSNLTDFGRQQAKTLGDEFQNLEFERVYSSPSKRAVETANIVANHPPEIIQDPRLLEIHLGSWQGKLISDLQRQDDERYFAYYEVPQTYQPDSGESFEQVKQRMYDFICDCIQKHQGERILVVTHGVAIRALLLAVLNLPVSKIWDFNEIDGTSVTKLVLEQNQITVQYVGRVVNSALEGSF